MRLLCYENIFLYPVLKHGPRSLTYMRVKRWKTPMLNETERGMIRKVQHPPAMILWEKGLSVSIHVGTQKMVRYSWIGWSQGKLWWKPVEILTCKSIVKFGYRGERLIEPYSSWFPTKSPLKIAATDSQLYQVNRIIRGSVSGMLLAYAKTLNG